MAVKAGAQGTVIAHVLNARNDKGVCRICLFDRAEAFQGDTRQPLQCQDVPLRNRMAEARFDNVRAGAYALFVFHDANVNGKFDTNFAGIPKEGYGASRNELPFAGAPTFRANKFLVPLQGVVELSIRLRNL